MTNKEQILRDMANGHAVRVAQEDQLQAWALSVGYKAVMDSNCPSWLKGWMSRRLMYGEEE